MRRRLFGALAAVAAVLLAALAYWRGAIPGLAAPGGPPAGTITYAISGPSLVRVDAGRRTARVSAPVVVGAQLFAGGFLLSQGELAALSPDGALRRIARAEGFPVGASPDGRTFYLARQVPPDSWTLDTVDIASGTLSLGLGKAPGTVLAGLVSKDGARLYLLVSAEGKARLQEFDLSTLQIALTHDLPGFEKGALLLLSDSGARLYLVGQGPVAMLEPGRTGEFRAMQTSGATPVAVLLPGTDTLLVAHAESGLLEVTIDPRPASRRIPGPRYTSLMATDRWLFAQTEDRLEVLDPRRPASPLSRITLPR